MINSGIEHEFEAHVIVKVCSNLDNPGLVRSGPDLARLGTELGFFINFLINKKNLN